jgi:hypothetical protein
VTQPNRQTAMKLRAALAHLEGSLQLLDDADAAADIGAHVDLAVHRLREMLSVASPGQSAHPDEQGT